MTISTGRTVYCGIVATAAILSMVWGGYSGGKDRERKESAPESAITRTIWTDSETKSEILEITSRDGRKNILYFRDGQYYSLDKIKEIEVERINQKYSLEGKVK